MTSSKPFVIIGAGPSGVIAAETLAKRGHGGDILLLGGEPEPPYSRMAIPYFLTGQIAEEGTYLRKADGHYDTRGIEYRQARVASVTPEAHELTLEDGSAQGYGKLLIATGATPIKPPVPGLDLAGVHHCWTLEDARHIVARATPGSDVVLMGAGFIGCIILEALVERGVNLTVVEALDRMVPRMMNETAGNLIKAWCESKGIRVFTSTRVTEVAEEDRRLAISLDSGEALPADLVVVAAGVKSNTGFLDGSGIEVKDGIVVDGRLKTGADDVYAAGDCAQGPDFSGGWNVHAIQPTASEHGRVAALNMAGREMVYQGSLNMNVLDTAGLISTSFGTWEGIDGGESAEVLDAENFQYMRLEFQGEHLVGALSLGRTDHVGVLRGLIQNKTRLGPWKAKLMADPHRIMEAYVAHAYA